MNVIQVAGHLGNDPEVRFTPSGQKVTSFRVATKGRRNSNNENDDTIWWRVTVWGERFDNMIQYFKKGSAIIVVGEIRKPSIYTNREGQPQVSLEITAEMLKFSPFGKSNSNNNNNDVNQNNGFNQVGAGQQQAVQNFNQPGMVGSAPAEDFQVPIPEDPPF